MRTVALICARGGSKGVPGKNIRLLGGKPLIAWSIEQARSTRGVESVIVSTDSVEIASVAKAAGAEVPFLRPAELAQDNSPEWLVWRHALAYMKERDGAYPDALLVVPATAPLRVATDLEQCLDTYRQEDVDVIITVTDAHRSPYFNMVRIGEDGAANLVIAPTCKITRRQDVPAVYDMTTVGYVVRPEFAMTKGGLFEGRVRAVRIPVDRALDIDTMHDFRLAEFLMSTNSSTKELRE